MNHLHKALVASNLNFRVKISTPQSMDIISRPFPPSTATFNSSWNSTIYQLLQFLLNTTFNFNNIPIVVTETGWPSFGAVNEPDATEKNAETYNNNLILRVLNGSGPPSQPKIALNTYLYELFNEDKRKGPVSEKNWGIFYANGSSVYPFSFSASNQSNGNSLGSFCVAKDDSDTDKLQAGLSWACGQGQANCVAIQPGRPCYFPNNVKSHASYAYNDYYQKMHNVGGTCDFDGTATTTTEDPSKSMILIFLFYFQYFGILLLSVLRFFSPLSKHI
ncbi:hypothetical protein V8G54_011607 [Vigna mungo]|uniref:glucan endo-1,3-beta-D-glucosidase n=1 Tax=Vigna mungo TaxID=3915 RepID=A0AAQ3S325_VIGMU